MQEIVTLTDHHRWHQASCPGGHLRGLRRSRARGRHVAKPAAGSGHGHGEGMGGRARAGSRPGGSARSSTCRPRTAGHSRRTSLTPAAVGVLAVWTGLAVLVFTPFPVWVGHWADAWQQRAGMTAPRVPARGGMVAAAVAAWAVMAIGLYLLLLSVDRDPRSDPVRHLYGISSRNLLRGMGSTDRHSRWRPARRLDGVPGHRGHAPGGGRGAPPAWRRSGDAHDAAVPRRRWVATVIAVPRRVPGSGRVDAGGQRGHACAHRRTRAVEP